LFNILIVTNRTFHSDASDHVRSGIMHAGGFF